MTDETQCLASLHGEYTTLIGVQWPLPNDIRKAAEKFIKGVGAKYLLSVNDRKIRLFAVINEKFRLNRERLQSFYDTAAHSRIYFDPSTKEHLSILFNSADRPGFCKWINSQNLPEDFKALFNPASTDDSLASLHRQLTEATIKRSDARQGVQAERKESVLRAIFCSWLFSVTDRKHAFAYFTGLPPSDVENEYFKHLQQNYPQVLQRCNGGILVGVSPSQISGSSISELRSWLFSEVDEAYRNLSNYSYIALLFRLPPKPKRKGLAWELINDVTLYAERCHNTKLRTGYFHPDKIRDETMAYVGEIDEKRADFPAYQYGFSFRDCVVLTSNQLTRENPSTEVESILLLLEKNVADETPIPCPACRSLAVRGNSYPVFGVKSWECQNPICPERSAFDRGNRFSVISILRNEAARDEKALVPESSLRQWKLDVVGPRKESDILEMFVRHYSLPGDKLTLVNWEKTPREYLGRILIHRKGRLPEDGHAKAKDPLSDFEQSPFFYRYMHVNPKKRGGGWKKIQTGQSWLELYQGSCIDVLANIPPCSIDGAVTSPPYYNAREYSTWPNLYCYLYDMKLAAEAVFRVLAPGSYYLFNIFDYFDNDNIVALSSLGKRRLVLGAYMTQIFRSCGFNIAGNIVWHKGEIEGKRNYNHGNRAPFFQLPLNTWEHILVLRKPGNHVAEIKFPEAILCRPVFKWFNGENKHGHTAPFPEEIPDLICSRLKRGATVLDPFGGSLTTAIACHTRGQRCIAVELHDAYCRLGLDKINKDKQEVMLF